MYVYHVCIYVWNSVIEKIKKIEGGRAQASARAGVSANSKKQHIHIGIIMY